MPIDGKWAGFYKQQESGGPNRLAPQATVYPIEAQFKVENGVITGSMRDLRTDHTDSFAGSAGPWLEELDQKKQRQWVDFIAAFPEAYVSTILPTDSMLSGRVDGDLVTFVKRYRGDQTTALVYGDTSETNWDKCAEVSYQGTLDSTGTVIRGQYGFPSDPRQPGDEFELRRVE